jgi:G3E family GTPase
LIPVSVITGFLGSGKTTLLARLLRDPRMQRTAVIVNEFGEIGLDHELIETSDENIVQLSNGCLCCNVRSDLVLTLTDLAARRAAGTVPAFDRVVVETTGLADPAPILHALMTDDAVNETYALDGVITTVDAVLGLTTLDRYGESSRQTAVADRIVLTKTDLGTDNEAVLRSKLRALNPAAPISRAVHGAIAPDLLFNCGVQGLRGARADARAWLGDHAENDADPRIHAHHSDGIEAFSLVRKAPLHAVTLTLFLSALAENCGPDLLRMKGICHIGERPESPAVIHGVQHVYHAPVWLERWPSADRSTRMVFIGRRLQRAWIEGLLELLDAEVADELSLRG